MSASPRRTVVRLPQEQRIRDILTAARGVIAEKGYENVLMSEIAERAGVVEGTLYRYFENKRDLLTKVAEDWFEEVLETDTELPAIRGTWNRLRHLVWRSLMSIRKQPALSRYMLDLRQHQDFRSTRAFELNKRLTSEISHLCEQAIASGEFSKDVSAPLLRDMIFGCIEHRTWSFRRGEGDFSTDDVADGITNVIYRGMAVKPPARQDNLDHLVERLEKAVVALEQDKGR